VYKRAILAPADPEAWLRAVLGGLHSRGIAPLFGGGSAAVDGPTARIALKSAWISDNKDIFSANVVFNVEARNSRGVALNKIYRGQAVRIVWGAGTATLQNAINRAFADALDAVAVDLKRLCGD
jgi:hypothetical protein